MIKERTPLQMFLLLFVCLLAQSSLVGCGQQSAQTPAQQPTQRVVVATRLLSTPSATGVLRPTPTATSATFRMATPVPEKMGPAFTIFDDSAYKYWVAVSGNIVAWYNALCYCNQAMDLATGDLIRITSSMGQQGQAAISGRYVVWPETRRDGTHIYGKNLATGEEFAVVTAAGGQSSPAISGSTVVWADQRSGNWDIYGKDLATGREYVIAAAASDQTAPAISGSTIVWVDRRNGNLDIYGKDLSTGQEFAIATGGTDEHSPAISGSLVLWMEVPGNIRGMDLSAGRRLAVVEDGTVDTGRRIGFDGSVVAWVAHNTHFAYSLLAKDLRTGVEYRVIEDTLDPPSSTAVAGTLVVWGASGGDGDVHGRRIGMQ